MATKKIRWRDKEVPATVVGFDIVKEDWRVYELQDGSTLRIKNTLVEVCRVNSERLPDGSPVYVVTGAEIVRVTDLPEHLVE